MPSEDSLQHVHPNLRIGGPWGEGHRILAATGNFFLHLLATDYWQLF